MGAPSGGGLLLYRDLLFTPLARFLKVRAQPPPSWNRRCVVFVPIDSTYPQNCLIQALFCEARYPNMDNPNTQQTTEQSGNSPEPPNHGSESPSSEQTPANKDNSEPTPQQSPPAEDAERAEEEHSSPAAEMTLDINNLRKAGTKTFTQRCRLLVGNLPLDMTEEEFKSMFAKYGNINEVFMNRERGFGFVQLVG